MRDHDEVYKRVIEEIDRYEQRRRVRRTMLLTRVIPAAVAVAVVIVVGLYVMWRGKQGNGAGIAPTEQPRVTEIAGNPETPGETPKAQEPGDRKPGYADADSEPQFIGSLNGNAFVTDSQIRDDGKEAYAYTRLSATGEGSYAGVTAEFYGIDRTTQTPVVITESEIATESEEGQFYGVVRYQVPEGSDIVIIKVVSDHRVSDGGGVGWENTLSTERDPNGFSRKSPLTGNNELFLVKAYERDPAPRVVRNSEFRGEES